MSDAPRMVAPRILYRWWRDEAAAELLEIEARMAQAHMRGDEAAAATLRGLQDRQIRIVATYDREMRNGANPAYLWGEERQGLVTTLEPVDARWGYQVAGPYCALPAPLPATERSEVGGRGRRDLYVSVTRKVSAKNGTAGAPAHG